MFRLRNLFRSTSPARTRTAKPTLEALDERIVPSTASSSIHAVTDSAGKSSEFWIGRSNNYLYQSYNTNAGGYGSWKVTNAPVQTLSAGTALSGHADVFFISAVDHSFWEYISAGLEDGQRPSAPSGTLKEILGPNYVGSFAAAQYGGVYFENWDHSLWHYSDGSGFQELVGPGQMAAGQGTIAAVTAGNNSVRDTIFVLRGDNTFGMYVSNQPAYYTSLTWSYTPLNGAGNVKPGFDAGLDPYGHADCFMKGSDSSFWEYDSYPINRSSPWQWLDAPGTVKAFSATDSGTVDAIAANGTLVQYEQNGAKAVLYARDTFTEISVAVSGVPSSSSTNDLYTVTYDSAGWEVGTSGYTLGYWNGITQPGWVL
jgi:hypothetical protein